MGLVCELEVRTCVKEAAALVTATLHKVRSAKLLCESKAQSGQKRIKRQDFTSHRGNLSVES